MGEGSNLYLTCSLELLICSKTCFRVDLRTYVFELLFYVCLASNTWQTDATSMM